MMKRIIFAISLILLSKTIWAQSAGFDYFGQKGPGHLIELFAPKIVSLSDVKEKSLAISPLGDEVFFSEGKEWPETKIMHVKRINNQWGKPQVADFCMDCFATEPAFSPDGKYLYFSSSKGETNIKQYCIWRMERTMSGWGIPHKIIDIADPNVWEFHPSVARNGSVYFCRWDAKTQKGDIFRSIYSNGVYAIPEKVDLPFDSPGSNSDPFIDPDEKYIIISSMGQKGKGGYDVYISHRKEDGSWLPPVNAGEKINTSGDEDSLDISPDGRFVFIYKKGDVYWAEAKGLIDAYL